MPKINYIVAFYIGDRVHTGYNTALKTNPLSMVEKHIESLRNTDIDLVSFVFNVDDYSMINVIEDLMKNYDIGFSHQCIFRNNTGGSYGAWNDVIKLNINDFDYFFLIEDDYIPVTDDFYNPFLERCSYKIPYVCGFVDKSWTGIVHPSVSNGILYADACKFVYNKYDNVFQIHDGNSISILHKNQMEFYDYFNREQFGITDILDEYSTPYMISNSQEIRVFGDCDNPVLLTPVIL